jgi:hypothetical protein
MRLRFIHNEFEKAQAEIDRLKTLLTAASDTKGEEISVVYSETPIRASRLEIEALDCIRPDAIEEEENR